MSDIKGIEDFRQGFCEKAAELGILPSELLAYSPNCKQAGILDFLADSAVNIPLTLGTVGLLGGAATGAIGNYIFNKAKFELDPDDAILPDLNSVEEAKRLHLLAKYRNAKKLVQAGLS